MVTLAPSDSLWLDVAVRDENGNSVRAITHYESSDTSVVTTAGNIVKAVDAGEADVEVQATWKTGADTLTVSVNVTDRVHSITVSPAADTLESGDTVRIVAVARDVNGEILSGIYPVWSSSNYGIAEVDDKGVVVAVGRTYGSVTITASVGTVSDTAWLEVPKPLTADHAALLALYHATDGDRWDTRYGWLTDRPLQDWYGVITRGGRVDFLILSLNNLVGSIPPELGNLTELRYLALGFNSLEGSIPPELGNLEKLRLLGLSVNNLVGSIPPELGNLSELYHLSAGANRLEGSIPPELGKLAKLSYLEAGGNQLSGSIPPELGNLRNLEFLWLGSKLTGPIPPELGNLSKLERMYLHFNDLSGPVPPEFGEMSSLRELYLTGNPAMVGALPSELTALTRLEEFFAGSTGLCAPTDADFQDWLTQVYRVRIARCADGEQPAAYLTQAVQSREFPVPLVAGEKALLRVFPTARKKTSDTIPLVRARFYRDGEETHEVDIPGKSTPIPDRGGRGRSGEVGERRDSGQRGAGGARAGGRDRPRLDFGPGAGGHEADSRGGAAGAGGQRHAAL